MFGIKEIKWSICSLKAGFEGLTARMDGWRQEIISHSNKIKSFSGTVDELANRCGNVETQNDDIHDSVLELKHHFKVVSSVLDEKSRQIASLFTHNASQDSYSSALRDRVKILEAENCAIKDRVRHLENENVSLKSRVRDIENVLVELNMRTLPAKEDTKSDCNAIKAAPKEAAPMRNDDRLRLDWLHTVVCGIIEASKLEIVHQDPVAVKRKAKTR